MADSFRKIEGYENYSINANGEVRNDKSERIMKQGKNGSGYPFVILCKNGKTTFHYIHRLIGKGFIYNPNNYPCIDHKNGKKTDNSIDNLRWCSVSQNMRNAKKRENASSRFKGVSYYIRHNKWVAQCNLNRKKVFVGYYDDEREAAIAYNNFIILNHLDDFNILNVV